MIFVAKKKILATFNDQLLDERMVSRLKYILGNATWRLSREDCGIELPFVASPKFPFRVVVNMAARVWVNEDVENATILHGPSDGGFVVSFWDEERVIGSKERSRGDQVGLECTDILKMGCWVTRIDCAVLLVPELKMVEEFSLQCHGLGGMVPVILPEKNVDVVRQDGGIGAGVGRLILRALDQLLGCHQGDETGEE